MGFCITKYRIVEEEERGIKYFYPQWGLLCFWFGYPANCNPNRAEFFSTKLGAKDFIDCQRKKKQGKQENNSQALSRGK